jgi:acetolactate synthase-1/2/3 large subunit
MPDLKDIASCYGLAYVAITSADGLQAQLASAIAQPWPIIIDVHLTPDEALSPKVAALPQPDGSMLSMPLEDMSPLLPLDVLRGEMLIPLTPNSLAAVRQ